MNGLKGKANSWRGKFSASLSLKLISIFVGGSIVLAILMGSISQYGLERQFFSTARPLLDHYLHYLAQEVGSPPSVARAQLLAEKWPITIRIFDRERNIRWASDGRVREPRFRKWHERNENSKQGLVYWDHGTVLLRKNSGDASVYYGLKLRPDGPPWFPLIFITLVLLGLVAFYWLTRRLFAPIKTIESGIARIGDGELNHRIELDRRDELGALANRVNQMAVQLESMMQAKRDLLLAISHELKSPLARSRVSLALLEDSTYREALLDDQREMQKLIDAIIDAERTQGNFALLNRERTNINELIAQLLDNFPAPLEIDLKMQPAEVYADVDALQIARLLRNLLENAVRYNNFDLGPVQLDCRLQGDMLILQVVDHGPGIEAHHLDRLTQAFYRADPSRERKSGGLGLGLYLCQAVVDAHQGVLTIESQPGQGTRVVCRIPC